MRYILSHKAIPVLQIELDEITGVIVGMGELYAPERLPVGISVTKGATDRQALNAWWTGRSIPATRSGLRDALDALQISSPQMLLTKCYGLSLSDQYWVCPEGSNLKWEDINFFDHSFSDDVGNILFGEVPDGEINLMSPDNTSDGWLKKKWIVADGKRSLIKGGSGATQQEPYNEVLASSVCKRLNISHIPYSLTMLDEYPYSVCEDFITSETELVAAWHICQTQRKPNHISSYQHYLNCCEALGIKGVSDALDRMLTVDYIIVNEDRHFNNFGAVRNAETLEWIGAAPIYDCGTSLWHSQPVQLIRPRTKQPSKPFKSDHAEQIKLVTSFDWLDLSALNGIDEEFSEIVKDSAFIDSARRDALCFGLQKRIELLREYVQLREAPARSRNEQER